MEVQAMTLADLLDSLAAKSPSPGGGAAAAVAGAIAAAAAAMVVNYSLGRKKHAEHESMLADRLARLTHLRAQLLALADEDAAAYARLSALKQRTPDDPQRRAGWHAAVAHAIAAPHGVMVASMNILSLAADLPGRSNEHLRSDLAVAAVLAESAAASAAWNVRINLELLDDPAQRTALETAVEHALVNARTLRTHIEAACR